MEGMSKFPKDEMTEKNETECNEQAKERWCKPSNGVIKNRENEKRGGFSGGMKPDVFSAVIPGDGYGALKGLDAD